VWIGVDWCGLVRIGADWCGLVWIGAACHRPVTGQYVPSHPNATHFIHSMKTSTSCDTITAISQAKGDAQAAIRIVG